MIQERRLRVTHTVHTRKNNRLLKTKKGLTNSLSLRQLSILSLTQSIVFQVWAKHATHSSSSLYHPSNMKLLEVHIFCFLFIEKGEFLRQILLNTNTFEIWISFYRTSGASASQVEFFFRESRNQIATENLPIDRYWGIGSGDCSVCLERLKKRKVTLKQCEATVWSGSEFAEHCFVFSNLSFFLVFPVYRTRSLHQSLNVC